MTMEMEMATKKKVKKKIRKKAAKKKVVTKAKRIVVTKHRLAEISACLEEAQKQLQQAIGKADALKLAEYEDTRRGYQQINNASLRVDAAIEELAR